MKMTIRKICTTFLLLIALVSGSYSVEKKALIIYFSMPERDAVDAVSGSSRIVEKGKVVGNVEWIARSIQSTVGGDLVALETVQQYPAKHALLVAHATEERKAGARPKLKATGIILENYDQIFLGYPIWWSDLPMPVYTFLEAHDFRGKKLIPFSSHGGSGLAGTIETIARLEPNARVIQNGFTVSRDSVARSKAAIMSWLNGLTLAGKR